MCAKLHMRTPHHLRWRAQDKKEAANAGKAAEPAVGHDEYAGQPLLNPLAVLAQVERALPPNAVLVGDGGDWVATAAYTLRPRGPLAWLDPGAFGTLGVGMGFALGAKLAMPDKEIWLVWGDGSVGYSVAEFDTALRHNLPIIALVGNDAAWSQIERDQVGAQTCGGGRQCSCDASISLYPPSSPAQVPILGDNVACPLLYSPYEVVARGYGGDGAMVKTDAAGEVGGVIAAARAAVAGGRSFLINVLIGKSDFREGSISV